MSRAAELLRRLGPAALVTALGLWLLWPVPSGVMPLSADHTVHLTRAWLYGQQLAGGHVTGWSPYWYFGFPLGELYPVLGDLVVAALRGASLGLLSWPQSYALAFTLVFLLQGWALLRCGRALGLGALPGLVAAGLALLDVGAYREGGWIYTVFYGVWPQALATSLAWLAFAELALAARAREDMSLATGPSGPGPKTRRGAHRHLAYAALAAGGALLAHPMSLPMFALGAPLWLLTVGVRGAGGAAAPVRARLAAASVDLGLALGLGLGLAAWWLWPMTAHSAWMASYGWLYAPLESMLRMLARGQWTQLMAPAAGWAALLGLAGALVSRGGVLRFVALWSLLHWLLASTDLFWGLRLDRLGSGFSHLQYQRFLTAAKPGLFLLAGAAVGGLWARARGLWSTSPSDMPAWTWLRGHARKASAGLLAAGALALLAWTARDAWTLAQEHEVGVVQTERFPGKPELDARYQELLAWLARVRPPPEDPWRLAVRADRNAHWFMDAPVSTGAPLYKLGFTPGDNFVHKPESGEDAVLDRAGVRYLLTHGGPAPRDAALVERFGPFQVHERAHPEPLAHVDGAGVVAVESADLPAGHARLRVERAAPGDRLVVHVAGYPRWDLSFTPDGGAPETVEWIEVPVVGEGPAATLAQRRAGELRGGKAHGDDGSEPTLISAPARDGVYTLRYVRWRWFDVAAALASLAALALTVFLYRSDRPAARLRPLARRVARPAVFAALALLLALAAGARWRRAAAREEPLASAWLAEGRVLAASGVRPGPLKTDMLIFPAVLVDARRGPAEVVFPGATLGPALEGWVALDDDDAKQRRRGTWRVEFAARPEGAADFTPLAEFQLAHRPDRQRLADRVPVPEAIQGRADLRVRVSASGEAPPRLGFDLALEAPGA